MAKIYLLITTVLLSTSVFGQQQTIKNPERLEQIEDYMADTDLHVPHYIFDSIIVNYQKGISGSSVKEGKLASSSLTVTDKGASIQVSLYDFTLSKNSTLYVGANLSGSGTDKFISVVKDGEYQNTISSGLVLNFFPGCGSAFFKHSERWQTRTITQQSLNEYYNLKDKPDDPFDPAKEIAYINEALVTLGAYEKMLDSNFGDSDGTGRQYQKKSDLLYSDTSVANLILKAKVFRDTLISLGILPKEYNEIKGVKERIVFLSKIATNDATTLRLKKFLAKAEKELMSAPWTAYSLHWFTIKPNFNVAPYKMINPDKKEDNYADVHNDQYFSLALSYNYTHRRSKGKQFQWSSSPTITFSNALDFTALTEQTITKTEDIQINGETVTKTLFNTVGYTEVPNRKWGWNFELPFTLFWNKNNFGFDIAIRGGENNPKGDNLGGRFGVYIPIEVKEGMPIWIEPILKIGKLGNSKNTPEGKVPLEFWKDNAEFGFNLVVAVPNFKVFKK